MRYILYYIGLITLPISSTFSQNFDEQYLAGVKLSDSLFQSANFEEAGIRYNDTFRRNGGIAYLPDRYAAAITWAQANQPDSAFFHIFRIIDRIKYYDIEKVENDSLLQRLRSDPRWDVALAMIKSNKQERDQLNRTLDVIFDYDQKYRLKVEATIKRYGRKSREMEKLNNLISRVDSINVRKVIAMIEKYGWPKEYIIGSRGITIFLVLQHADLHVQEKYLPWVKSAVEDGELEADKLALYEDRIAVNSGKCQRYGSQIGFDAKSKRHYILPLFDPAFVDDRRKEIGLGPLQEYVKDWKIRWDPSMYKAQITRIHGIKFNCDN
jgi:hypothetical protein